MTKHDTRVTLKTITSDINKSDSAIREAVANAIDANSKNIYVKIYEEEDTGSVSNNVFKFFSLDIADDGDGIPIEDKKFEEVFCQYKVSSKTGKTNYGRKGKGRYTYLVATNSHENITIFTKANATWYKIKFSISENETIQIAKSNNLEKPKTLINKDFTTLVQLKNLKIDNISPNIENITLDNLLQDIKSEIISFFADRIASESIKIYINDELIKIDNYLDVPKKSETIFIETPEDISIDFEVDFYIWNDKIKLKADRQKHILFLDDNNKLKGIAPSGKHKLSIANKKQNHTIIVKSGYFNNIDYFIDNNNFNKNLFTDKNIEILRKKIALKLEEILFSIYKKNLDKVSEEYISFLKISNDDISKKTYYALMYPIIEKLGKRKVHDDIKSIIAHLVDSLIKVSPDSYIQNIQTILNLSPEDSLKVEYIERNYGIVKAIAEKQKYIERIDILNNFDEMVNGKQRTKVKERTMLHHVIDKNLWIIDEKFEEITFSDIASDVSLKTILENDKFYCFDNTELEEITKEYKLNKVPDIFIPIKKEEIIYVVELKKPGVKISQKIINEVMNKYTNALKGINNRLDEQDRKKIFAIAISDDKTGNVYTVGDLNKDGVRIEPRTWKEVIDNTRNRYNKLIKDIDHKLKTSKWKSLEDFINDWNNK